MRTIAIAVIAGIVGALLAGSLAGGEKDQIQDIIAVRELVIVDEQNRKCMQVSGTEGHAAIIMYDQAGKIRAYLDVTGDGSNLALKGPRGESAALGVKNGLLHLVMDSADHSQTIMLGHDQGHNFSISIHKQGEVIFIAPEH